MKTAYNWTREISPDRLRKLDSLKRSWEYLFSETNDRGHYARIQWCGKGWEAIGCKTFDATIGGKSVKIHLRVVTAREWFAKEAYNHALAETRKRYPDFEAHHFVDGDRIGERRICFESESNALSSCFLSHQLWHIVNESGLSISETWFSETCNEYGSVASQITKGGPSYQTKDDHLRFTVVRDVDKVEEDLLSHIKNEICTCGFPTVSNDKLVFDWEGIKSGIIELSDPELVALNWADARPVPTPADLALDQAVNKLNLEGIRKALAEGANPNLTNESGENRLCATIQSWQDHLSRCSASEEDLEFYGGPRPEQQIPIEEIKKILQVLIDAGADPNYFSYEEPAELALVNAVLAQEPEIVRLLLDCGADPTISPFWDDGPGMTPAAWDYAATDGFALDEQGARECYYAMVKNHSLPFGSRSAEEQARHDAELPDHLRSWRKNS